MKTDLPAPAEYYRRTRARELREKAARLKRTNTCVTVLATLAVLAVGVFLGPSAWWVLLFSAFAWGFWGVLFTAVLTYLLSVGYVIAVERLAERMSWTGQRLRDEAAALEAEHEARYGELPVVDESKVKCV
jgi:uncharacterized membrane protein YcjF (UPF0283 family)